MITYSVKPKHQNETVASRLYVLGVANVNANIMLVLAS